MALLTKVVYEFLSDKSTAADDHDLHGKSPRFDFRESKPRL